MYSLSKITKNCTLSVLPHYVLTQYHCHFYQWCYCYCYLLQYCQFVPNIHITCTYSCHTLTQQLEGTLAVVLFRLSIAAMRATINIRTMIAMIVDMPREQRICHTSFSISNQLTNSCTNQHDPRYGDTDNSWFSGL